MMGRFSLSTSSSNASTSNTSTSSSITSSLGSMANISNISIPNMKLKEMTKRVSVGLNTSSMTTNDVKAKNEAEERKQQISQTLATLEDTNLQSPSSHTGLILAYTNRNLSPVISPGIKFRWFRMRDDQVEPVEESFKAWYAPTVDDIGCMICVQCEDNFDQGCSRYLECGPLKVDPLLQTVADSAINSGVYEVRGVSVSLGLAASDSVSSIGAISEITESHTETMQIAGLSTVLSKDTSFLQMNGFSTIEVDEKGIFISIPTASIKGRDSKHSFNTSRRGLRIPANAKMHVSCVQPQSLVLTLPITRKNIEGTEHEPSNQSTEDNEQQKDEAGSSHDEDKMKAFLSSSIVAIPWTYEGHNLSPQAYITENESKLSPEERERILKEAEEDSINFASTICALAEFISSLPEGTNELLLCFGCGDRITRDTLAISMRALACQAEGTSRHERKRVLPWLMEDGQANSEVIAENNESDLELRKRLKQVEEENSTLKRERNELTKQLLETKEEIAAVKSHQHRAQRGVSQDHSSADDESTTASLPTVIEGEVSRDAAEQMRELSSKVIELENRLSMSTKKEGELEKLRDELESKQAKMTIEMEKLKKISEEATTKATTIQTLFDHQSQSLSKLEIQQEENIRLQDALRLKQKEMDELQMEIAKRDKLVQTLEDQLVQSKKQHEADQATIQAQHKQVQQSQDALENANRQQKLMQTEFDSQLASTIIESKRLERELHVSQENQKAIEIKLQSMKDLEEKLKQAEDQVDVLKGEMNHLQRKSESQTRDLKKTMKENAHTLLEFEKALARKSGECNEAYMRIQELEEALRQTESILNNVNNPGAAAAASASAFMEKISTTIQQRRPSMMAFTSTAASSDTNSTGGGDDEDSNNAAPRGRTLSSATSAATSAATSLFRRLSIRPTSTGENENTNNDETSQS